MTIPAVIAGCTRSPFQFARTGAEPGIMAILDAV